MKEYQSSNRRVAKNTLVLYLRMFVMMAISLFASRVIFQVLGVNDYGVQNVVGGFVGMFSILSSSMTNAVSRFITFEIGKGDINKLNRVFCTCVNVQIMMVVIVSLVLEIVGGWFLNTHLSIPCDRIDAANWVFHCAVLSFAINLICIPYGACIVGHEKMSIYAFMAILDAILKLSIIYALYISPFDKLKTIAVLGVVQSILMQFIYGLYSKLKFEECTYRFIYDKRLLKEITGFAGWNFFGEGCFILSTQGISILLNMFFGVTLNAARGIAASVDGVIQSFSGNFMTALSPQITKTYAVGELPQMHDIICRGAKFSCFLILLLIIPLCIETHQILYLWLGSVPEYAVLFTRWALINSLTTIIGKTLVISQFATGRVKRYQLIMALFSFWVFPLTWLAFMIGLSPVYAYTVYFVMYFIMNFVRLYLVKDLIRLSVKRYVFEVMFTVFIVGCISLVLPLILYFTQEETFLRLIEVCITSVVCIGLSAYYIGMRREERQMVLEYVKSKVKIIPTKTNDSLFQ